MKKLKDRWKRASRGRGHDNKGRSKKGERFVKLDHWLLETEAWLSLGAAARALYVELLKRYNGSNNGEISVSVREAARLLHISKDTAGNTFRELEEKGFVKRHICGSFNWKLKRATSWILTAYEMGEQPATKEFARWRPPKEKHGPKPGTNCAKSGTVLVDRPSSRIERVLISGPFARISRFFGPIIRHAYSLPCHAPACLFLSRGLKHPGGGTQTLRIAVPPPGCFLLPTQRSSP